jgi:hypothetical protein
MASAFGTWDAPNIQRECSRIFAKRRGEIRVPARQHLSAHGEYLLLGLGCPGEPVGAWWVVVTVAYPASAVAAVPYQVHRLSLDSIRVPDSRGQATADLLRQTMHMDLCLLAAALLDFRALPPAELPQQHLWDLAAVLGNADSATSAGQARFLMPLNNAEIAGLCVISESHYKAVCRQLEAAGALERKGRRLWILRPVGAPFYAGQSRIDGDR